MKPPQSYVAWEGIHQVAMAFVFFAFVLFAYHNGMSKTDIAMWISLVCTSLGVDVAKYFSTRKPPSDEQ